jgi:8-oxo-dGTP pyrophosphatase MutT (NUDIX family)
MAENSAGESPQNLPRQIGPWSVLASRAIYTNAWIHVREDRVVHPHGEEGIYGVVSFRNLAVGVVPLDAEGEVTLVGQHRFPLDYYSWEIPEGGCRLGEEDPAVAAIRELREETGLRANRLDYLGCFTLSNSVTDEVAHLFLGRDLVADPLPPDATEVLALKKIPFEQACRQAEEGELNESLSVIALLRARRFLERERLGLAPIPYPSQP